MALGVPLFTRLTDDDTLNGEIDVAAIRSSSFLDIGEVDVNNGVGVEGDEDADFILRDAERDVGDDNSTDLALFFPRLILSCNGLLYNDLDEDLSL